jgi:polysaccharide pyruvyl transferase WcaK-like protein
MNKRFLLYGHGGSYNHGAEAIVQTTIQIIRKKYPKAEVMLSSHFPEQDMEFGIDADKIIGSDITAWEAEKTASLEHKTEFAKKMYSEALASITSDTTLLSVGGDVFCYPNWHRLSVFQHEATKKKAKSILWGCSVEPSDITQEMIEVFNSYTHIITRESYTYNALQNFGINSDIQLLPDPAFLLEPKSFKLPDGFQAENIVGINISPLVINKEAVPGILLKNMRVLIDFIILETNMNIALIPHVTMPMDNDYSVLVEIEQSLPSSYCSRICLIAENHSAAELKSLIARCSLLVCARTHASIAAYSSGVPALVLGYSIKSKGIAEDLGLGEFVIDINDIKSPCEVKDMFKQLYDRIVEVKNTLDKKMNSYIENIINYSMYI